MAATFKWCLLIKFMPKAYTQKCCKCGVSYNSLDHQIYCYVCGKSSLLVTDYKEPISLDGPDDSFFSYNQWLPYDNVLDVEGPIISCFHAKKLGSFIGLNNLWVVISGYSPNHGSNFMSGTFKECEAIGVMSRVRAETDKVLIVSSAGNAGRSFLSIGSTYHEPVVVIVPDSADVRLVKHSSYAPIPLYSYTLIL